jgi:gamma-glutamyl hercynylcysteine S-oxide synthase
VSMHPLAVHPLFSLAGNLAPVARGAKLQFLSKAPARVVLVAGLLIMFQQFVCGQGLDSLILDTRAGLAVSGFVSTLGTRSGTSNRIPLLTCAIDDSVLNSLHAKARKVGDSVVWKWDGGLSGSLRPVGDFTPGWKGRLILRNTGNHPVRVGNVVPLGEGNDRVYIAAAGSADVEHRLARSRLFRPGVGSVGVILPDNAWELGFCDVRFDATRSLTGITRRTAREKGEPRRFFTILQPGGSVQYDLFVDAHTGDWHRGLAMMFRDRWLYDLTTFDNALFERPDLQWIRKSYLLLLQFAWDHQYIDALHGKSTFEEFLLTLGTPVGGFEGYMLWPTWPRLGIDQRSQWDMYRDLPGGLPALREQAAFCHTRGTKFFISYNPWDESTRKEDHIHGMEEMLRAVDADGVVLDTWGESRKDFQAAADRVKPGIILYSEGMAVPQEMPGIVAGRVHDAIYYAPPLNLNKLIKPEFAIFRVLQLAEGRIHREIAMAFFNGYGSELNIMRPGRPSWMPEEMQYLGRVTKILRENSSAFLSRDWTPLLPTTRDSVWVNAWPTTGKTIYTVLGMVPAGFSGPLFAASIPPDSHFVSLWHHEELDPVESNGQTFLPTTVEGFSAAWLGTRREGTVDCIARFPRLLAVVREQDSLTIAASAGTSIKVWAGEPLYEGHCASFATSPRTISLLEHLGRYEGKVVVQLFGGTELIDERIITLPLATPRLVSKRVLTPPATTPPDGMVAVPGGQFQFKTRRSFLSPNEVIPYPGTDTNRSVWVAPFFIDQYPVTNEQFALFLRATHYMPEDTNHFLRQWARGKPPAGLEHHPVVYVSRTDAEAYARWAGKRLPTECEWQYAAQGTDRRKYPWGNVFDSTRCNVGRNATTPVDAYPTGASPFDVRDLVGNVWQMTGDVYDNGTFYFQMLRGGSYFDPASSWWYVKGGPQPVDNPQILLLVSPGLDRNATVGFRCVKDADISFKAPR